MHTIYFLGSVRCLVLLSSCPYGRAQRSVAVGFLYSENIKISVSQDGTRSTTTMLPFSNSQSLSVVVPKGRVSRLEAEGTSLGTCCLEIAPYLLACMHLTLSLRHRNTGSMRGYFPLWLYNYKYLEELCSPGARVQVHQSLSSKGSQFFCPSRLPFQSE